MTLKVLLAVGFAFFLQTQLDAIVIRDDQSYLDHATLAQSPELGSVLRVRSTFGDTLETARTYTASAVYIGYGFFLTAGHVLYGDGRDLATMAVLNQYGSSIASVRNYSLRTHPEFSGSDFAGTFQNDIGMFWTGVPSSGGMGSLDSLGKPRYPAASLWTGELGVGSELTIAGFGRRGTGSSPGTLASGTFAVGKNTYDQESFGGKVGYFDFDSHLGTTSNLGSSQPLPHESIVNPGDSGGGWFSPTQDGRLALTHITSGIWGNLDGVADGSYGDIGMGVSISYYHQWIQQQAYDILYAVDPYTYPMGEWATFDTVPEPSSLILFLIGLSFVVLGRSHGWVKF